MPALEEVVIVGASLAGWRAAEALRQLGFAGRVVLIGDEEHAPYDRPPLSKDLLAGKSEVARTALAREGQLAELDLDLKLGRAAAALDAEKREVVLEGGERVGFDGLVIATGCSPRTLPLKTPAAGVHTLRSLDDCLAIRGELEAGPRVAVVGAGFIGAEVAATCRSRGLAVTLIDPLPVPFGPVLGDDVGAALQGEHEERGVQWRLGVGVTGFEGEARVEALRLDDGTRIEADLVVVGIGVRPETAWLEGSGIALDDGVRCDAACRTSLPGVVAAGDVARWPNPLFGDTPMRIEHWTNAAEQARHAVATLLAGEGEAQPFAPVPFFWSDQYELKIQAAGYLRGFDEARVVHGSLADRKFVKLYGRGGQLVAAVAFGEPRRLIGYRRKLRTPMRFEAALAEAAESA